MPDDVEVGRLLRNVHVSLNPAVRLGRQLGPQRLRVEGVRLVVDLHVKLRLLQAKEDVPEAQTAGLTSGVQIGTKDEKLLCSRVVAAGNG